jgi:hypothetical protein
MSIDCFVLFYYLQLLKLMQQKKAEYNQQLTAADKFIATSGAGATHSIWEDSVARKDQNYQSKGQLVS